MLFISLSFILSVLPSFQFSTKMGKSKASSPSVNPPANLTKVLCNRKTKNILSLECKLKVIELLKEGKSQRNIAESLGVSKSQVHRIGASKEKLIKFSDEKVFQPTAKIMVDLSKNSDLDRAVLKCMV